MKFNKQIFTLLLVLVAVEYNWAETLNKRSPQDDVNQAPNRQDSLVFHPRRTLKKRPQQPTSSTESPLLDTEAPFPPYLSTETGLTPSPSVEEEAYLDDQSEPSEFEKYKKLSTIDCKKLLPGFYTSPETGCKIWHMCANNIRWDFPCPRSLLFSQQMRVCMREPEVECDKSADYYGLNEDLYKPVEKKMIRKKHRTTTTTPRLVVPIETQQ